MEDNNQKNDAVVGAPIEKFREAIAASGLGNEDKKSGWIKVQGPFPLYRVYVPIAKKTVKRVDISGFEVGGDAGFPVKNLGGQSFGRVHQQLDMRGLTEEQVLLNFSLLLEHMKTLPEPKLPEKAAPKETSAAGGETPSTDDKASRLALIKKVAEEKGMAVSQQTLAEAGELDQAALASPEESEELPDAGV